ncbi:hypothetical protein BpHYR1_003356 [Brachionus plicatilis]|uniref:Uncharacterized protein n=1 Tax=Brachionus plicatilis TaxID=10195 RepID=A0A3M7R0J2_BRAPC|nr:hypothetical protein BpHYR1_003356 [Brachionus plicatilis]
MFSTDTSSGPPLKVEKVIYFVATIKESKKSLQLLFPRIENNTHIYHPNIYSAIEALKTEENQIAFAYNGKIPVPYRRNLVVYTDTSYTFRRQILLPLIEKR